MLCFVSPHAAPGRHPAVLLPDSAGLLVLLTIHARGSSATRPPPLVADAYMAAMQRTTSNPISASMPRK
jgi:hypothetical protein